MKREIIKIDEDKCTGCGLCVPNCAEGSLEIRNGKAVLVKEALCDGLGACLGHCPEGALTIEVRESDEFDEDLVEVRLAQLGRPPLPAQNPIPAAGGCPSSQALDLKPAPTGGCPSSRAATRTPVGSETTKGEAPPSQLGHWPVQLALLPPTAPFFRDQDLVISAHCAPVAIPDFHRRFLAGRAVAIACPKLDNPGPHYQKLIKIFEQGGLKSARVVRMEVPCCGGLTNMVTDAWKEAGAAFPLVEVVIGRDGTIQSETELTA